MGRGGWRDEYRHAASYKAEKFTAEAGDNSIRAYRDEVLASLESNTNLVGVGSQQEYSGELITAAGYEQEALSAAATFPAPPRSLGQKP